MYNDHLKKSANCNYCQTPETKHHFLLECPKYSSQKTELMNFLVSHPQIYEPIVIADSDLLLGILNSQTKIIKFYLQQSPDTYFSTKLLIRPNCNFAFKVKSTLLYYIIKPNQPKLGIFIYFFILLFLFTFFKKYFWGSSDLLIMQEITLTYSQNNLIDY